MTNGCQRYVALKFLSPHLSTQPAAKARFLTEARAVAALDHPSVCAIYEIGETMTGNCSWPCRCTTAKACRNG